MFWVGGGGVTILLRPGVDGRSERDAAARVAHLHTRHALDGVQSPVPVPRPPALESTLPAGSSSTVGKVTGSRLLMVGSK